MYDERVEYQIWNDHSPKSFLIEIHPDYEQAKARWDELVNMSPSLTFRLHKVVWQAVSVTPLAVSDNPTTVAQ